MPARPNVLIIGAARSGTTALAALLGQQPGFRACRPKELHFFAHHGAPRAYRGPGDAEMIQRHIVTDPARFERHFDARSPFRLEGSVSTLYRPEVAIDNIGRYASPDVKLLVILREPAARAWSGYRYLRSRGYESATDLAEALDREDTRVRHGYHHLWHYRRMSCYRAQLDPFRSELGDRLRIVIYEELFADQVREVNRVLDFLGASHQLRHASGQYVNRGGEPRCRALQRTITLTRRNRPLSWFVNAATPRSLRERIRNASLRPAGPDRAGAGQSEAFGALYRELRAERAYVERVLGRPVPSWERPEVDRT